MEVVKRLKKRGKFLRKSIFDWISLFLLVKNEVNFIFEYSQIVISSC